MRANDSNCGHFRPSRTGRVRGTGHSPSGRRGHHNDRVPDDGFVIELALIGLLILLNGFFAATEIAVVSARRSRLQAMVEQGNRKAEAAVRLKADMDRFLATVQIGVTVVSTLASAVGGVAGIERLEPLFASLGSRGRE
jgi:hypothetical protein